jgi:hypothetical protein
MRTFLVTSAVLVAMMAVGCGGASQGQSPDAAGSDGGMALDAPWSPPFSGRRAFIVSSQVLAGSMGGAHTFTLVFDADRRIAIVGANRTGSSSPLQATTDGAFSFTNAVSISSSSTWIEGRECPGDSIQYDALAFEVDAEGNLTGSGRGQLNRRSTGVIVDTTPARMSLTGVPDTEGPIVGLYSSALGSQFTPFKFASSEPLPDDARPVLRSAGGSVVALKPSPGDVFGIEFSSPVLLPYLQSYTIDIENIVDFAGNRPTVEGVLTVGTGPPPLLVAADGFESQQDMLVAGTAQFLSSPDVAIISGARSLYVPPENSTGIIPVAQFTLRLAMSPGDTVLRFAYRTISVGTVPVAVPEYLVGSVGGTLVTATLPPDNEPGMPATIGGPVTLGPLRTATINLPDDASGEVVFARLSRGAPCGRQTPGLAGLLLDDLRTE